MRFRGREQSQNVEDRRRSGTRLAATGGGIGILVMALLVWFLGGNPQAACGDRRRDVEAGDRADAVVREALEHLHPADDPEHEAQARDRREEAKLFDVLDGLVVVVLGLAHGESCVRPGGRVARPGGAEKRVVYDTGPATRQEDRKARG